MVEIAKVTINWTGFAGAPGYTNLYWRDFETSGLDQAIIDGAVTKTDTWISSVQSRVPTSVRLRVNRQVEIIESTTGQLTRFMQATADTTERVGTGTGAYSAASGLVVNWYTDGVVRGRRVRGRTFIVPLAGNALDTDGSIAAAALTGMATATTTLISNTGVGDLGVWSRPSAPGATDGQWFSTTSFTIPDKAAVLRSRRD